LNAFYDRHSTFYEYTTNVPDELENFVPLGSMPHDYRCTDDHNYMMYGASLDKLKKLKLK
jgi:hypothetical protein